MYCNDTALVAPVGDCPAGYFCPEGTDDPQTNACARAFYLAYEGAESNQDCAECPSGYYCPSSATVEPVICPAGTYCPPGVHEPSNCPLGTYSNSTGLKQSSSCLACPPGEYCQNPGITEPTGPCRPGYFCQGGSTTDAPTDGVYGDVCPAGAHTVVFLCVFLCLCVYLCACMHKESRCIQSVIDCEHIRDAWRGYSFVLKAATALRAQHSPCHARLVLSATHPVPWMPAIAQTAHQANTVPVATSLSLLVCECTR